MAFLAAIGVPLIASHLSTLAALIVGTFLGESAHLPTIAAYMPLQIKQRSRLRRLERWIASEKVEPIIIMAPYAKWYLSQLKDPTLYMVLDFTTNTDKFLIAMVSVIIGKRTVPLYWTIGLAKECGVSRKKLSQEAVRQVAKWVPKGKNVVFIADREFRSREWRKLIQKELKWHFVLRLSRDKTYVFFEDGSIFPDLKLEKNEDGDYVCALNKLTIKKGEAYYYKGVRLTLKKDGPYQLAIVWDEKAKEPWILVSDLKDPKILPDIYARRWAIESTFRDLKSYGFDIEASRITDINRFNRMLIGVCLAYGWAVRIGHYLDQTGHRHLVDRGSKHKLSLYRIGRHWLLHLWGLGSPTAHRFNFGHVPFPRPPTTDHQPPA